MEDDSRWRLHLFKGSVDVSSVSNVASKVGCGSMATGWSAGVDIKGIDFTVGLNSQDVFDKVMPLKATAACDEDTFQKPVC